MIDMTPLLLMKRFYKTINSVARAKVAYSWRSVRDAHKCRAASQCIVGLLRVDPKINIPYTAPCHAVRGVNKNVIQPSPRVPTIVGA